MQNQTPNLERYILAELQGMSAADTYIVSSDIWVDCINSHKIVHVFKKSDNTLVTTLYVNIETGAVSSTAPTGSITVTECNSDTKTSFQIIDCSGANVGTPLSVEQTIVVNKVLTSICNVSEIFQPIVDELHDHIEPLLEKLADAVQPYQPVDCAGANVGSPVDATNVKIVNATDIFCAIVTAIDSAKVAIVDAVNNANTDITAAIEASTLVLEDIKTELITANTTLTNIKTDTASINTKLDTVITKIDTMITSLSSIDTKLTTTNSTLADILLELQGLGADLADIKIAVESIDLKLDDVITSLTSIETKLDTLHTDLVGIKDTLDDILAQLDHELIITSPTINCADDNGTKVSFYTREKIVWDSESGTEISKTVEYSLDGEDFTAAKPAGTITIGACVTAGDITASLVEFQVVDCDDNNIGDPIESLPVMVVNKTTTSICNHEEISTPIVDAIQTESDETQVILNDIKSTLESSLTTFQQKDCDGNNIGTPEVVQKVLNLGNQTVSICNIQELADAISGGGKDYTALLTEISDKQTLIKDAIDAFKAENNTNLLEVIAKLELQLDELVLIKDAILDGNIKLSEIIVKLEDVNANLEDIKVSVASIDSKLTVITDSLTAINTTIQDEFDETQVILNDLKDSIESTLTTFQAKDCTNANIGTPEVAQKSVILNKVITSLCNFQELADAINAGQTTSTGKAHDVNSIVMTVGQTLSIPSGHFSTLVFHAAKGEFKIENTSNDHSTIFTTTGTVSKFIEISEDGVGTATGSTNAPMTMDTRSNANDLAITNTYTITAVRAGVLKLETYKN